MKMTTNMGFACDEHVSNTSYAEPPISQKKKRIMKKTINKLASEKPPLFLLALEEVKKPGSKAKREISKKIIPLCLYALGKTVRKRNLVNDSIVDKVIEKYFPKIKVEPPFKSKHKCSRREVHTSPNFIRNVGLSKEDDYSLSSKPLNIDKLDVITEANRTLDHISKHAECDSVEMPEAMKKPLVAVLFKRISNIYADQNRINKI
nr:uncharacterized protein LOC112211574 isoform X2 [Halyomorpha halys]